MGNQKLNRKGFTLIELLAVIVILAILILLAMPSVLNIMENARKNSLVTEAESIISSAKTLYASEALDKSTNGTTCYSINVKSGDENTATLASYVDKDLTSYSGAVTISIADGKASYTIDIYNGTYYLKGTSGKLDKKNVSTTKPSDFKEKCTTDGGAS